MANLFTTFFFFFFTWKYYKFFLLCTEFTIECFNFDMGVCLNSSLNMNSKKVITPSIIYLALLSIDIQITVGEDSSLGQSLAFLSGNSEQRRKLSHIQVCISISVITTQFSESFHFRGVNRLRKVHPESVPKFLELPLSPSSLSSFSPNQA